VSTVVEVGAYFGGIEVTFFAESLEGGVAAVADICGIGGLGLRFLFDLFL
jgi:hypothetical protein